MPFPKAELSTFLTNFRRHEQEEQQNHWESQNQVRQERQNGVSPSAIKSGRQAQCNANHKCKHRGSWCDGQNRATTLHHSAEHISGEVIATQ